MALGNPLQQAEEIVVHALVGGSLIDLLPNYRIFAWGCQFAYTAGLFKGLRNAKDFGRTGKHQSGPPSEYASRS